MPRGNGRIFASPLARRMAQQAGARSRRDHRFGSAGPHRKSRYRSSTFCRTNGQPRLRPGPSPDLPQPPQPRAPPTLSKERVLALSGNPPYTERPFTAMRRVIARRLTESKQTVPHFYLTVDCEIDELLKFRAELNGEIRRLPDLSQ